MIHKGTKDLNTNRLKLRKLTLKDSKDMYKNWASDEEVTKYLTWKAYKSCDDVKEMINKWIENYNKDDFYHWGIELKEIGEVIGTISVVNIKEDIEEMEVGYCIGKEFWNRGITTEALKCVMEYLFKEVDVNRISLKHDTRNIASGEVMKKAGLEYEGTLKKASKNNLGIVDIAIYGKINPLK